MTETQPSGRDSGGVFWHVGDSVSVQRRDDRKGHKNKAKKKRERMTAQRLSNGNGRCLVGGWRGGGRWRGGGPGGG